MSKNKFFTGLVFGAAAGAIAGILLAPDKGTETRKKIAQKAGELKSNVMDQAGMIAEKLLDTGKAISGKYKEAVTMNAGRPEAKPAEQQNFS